MRKRVLPATELLLALLAGPVGAQDSVPSARWQLSAQLRAGVPSGWVQVRENTIAGTRLGFGPQLDVHSIWAADFRAEYAADTRTRLSFTLTSFALAGTVTLPANVNFNGTTLQGGTKLTTDTRFPHWIAATFAATRRVASTHDGELGVTAGLSFVALTFVLHGTLTPTSATRETQEDFVTQELPVPILGAEYRTALGSRWRFDARVTGGWLPWVNSLRQEGGTVTVTQTELQLAAEFRYAVSRSVDATGELRFSEFAQDEQSTEDGNQISVRYATIGLGAAWKF